jgi:hypothetical protein
LSGMTSRGLACCAPAALQTPRYAVKKRFAPGVPETVAGGRGLQPVRNPSGLAGEQAGSPRMIADARVGLLFHTTEADSRKKLIQLSVHTAAPACAQTAARPPAADSRARLCKLEEGARPGEIRQTGVG